ncbi:multiple sugar transport system substrate-binding protein [Microlunatus parietis]|uniref:Multiple sugar transport system substrate-binding protein n=1 Tax=Microlunatus parietis TaxID=682979 RepID=A0A7Y9I8M1_9ACTN|nr:multiple sugar transport system substrate-binding protein [Microlunatus parietis]
MPVTDAANPDRGSTERPSLSRRSLLRAGGLLTAGLAVGAGAGCTVVSSGRDAMKVRPNKEPAPGRKTTIEIYNIWGSTTGAGLVECARLFEESQDEIAVRVTFGPTPGGGSTIQQKLFTAIAGNQAPDIGFCDAALAPSWTKLRLMKDLTPYFERDGIRLEDFFPVCAASMAYQDRVWSVQWDADANFPFFWNKGLFAECGLDPERPPTTIDEIDLMAAEINRVERGQAVQVGILPWNQYGAANSMLTWGYSFGGKFWNTGTNDVTTDDEPNIRALEWMTKSAQGVGGAQAAVNIAPPSLQIHPFSTGKIGMTCLVTPNLVQIKELYPDLDIGATLLPYQPPGASRPGEGAWLGGWSCFIPRTAPQADAAWEFVKWFSISDEGTKAQWDNIGFPVGYAKAPVNEEIAADPDAGVYHETLRKMEHTRPLVTVSEFHHQQMETMVQAAVYGQLSPKEALTQIKNLSLREAARFDRVG